MKCPNCGASVDGDSPFCPSCGADLTGDVRRRRRLLSGIDRSVRLGVSAAVVVVAAVAVLAVVLSALPGDDGPEAPEGSVSAGGFTVVLSDGFGDGTMYAEPTPSGLLITLDADAASGYTQFQWRLWNNSGTEASTVTKSDPTLLWMDVGPGVWTVSVSCGDAYGYYGEYHGTMDCRGDYDVSYSWAYGGRTLGVSFTLTYDQLSDAASADRPGEGATASEAASLVDAGGAAGSLESKIWSAFRSQSSSGRASEDYACCLLEFVSSCFEERPDLVTYGASEHWATPEETVSAGAGDTGDLAVLAASLLKSAGFDVCLVQLQGGWAVGVALEPEDAEAGDGRTVMTVEADGRTYWVCDVSDFAGIGRMPSAYSEDGTTYYGAPAEVSVGIC